MAKLYKVEKERLRIAEALSEGFSSHIFDPVLGDPSAGFKLNVYQFYIRPDGYPDLELIHSVEAEGCSKYGWILGNFGSDWKFSSGMDDAFEDLCQEYMFRNNLQGPFPVNEYSLVLDSREV